MQHRSRYVLRFECRTHNACWFTDTKGVNNMSVTVTPKRKTRAVARELNVGYWTLYDLLRGDRIPAPEKDESGDLQWTDEDVANARAALAARAARRRRA